MASARVETVLELAALWNTGDVDQVMDALGDEFEFTPDPRFPESGPFRGEAARAWMHEWASTWTDNELEVLGTEERGDGVLIRSRWRLTAPDSELTLPVADFTIALFFDDADRAIAMAGFFDHEQARQAIESA